MFKFEQNSERESVSDPLDSNLNTILIPSNLEPCIGPSSVIIESQDVPIPDQASFFIKPSQPEPIVLPAPQEAVIEVIVDSSHRSPILEESEETNSDSSSKMDLVPASVPPGDAGITGHQDAAQPEAILDAPEEVKVTPDLVTEVNTLVVEDFSQLTLDKGDAASGDPGLGTAEEQVKEKLDATANLVKDEVAVVTEPGPAKKPDKGKAGPPKAKPLAKPQRPAPTASKTSKALPSTTTVPKPLVKKAPAESLQKPGPARPPSAPTARPPSTAGRPTSSTVRPPSAPGRPATTGAAAKRTLPSTTARPATGTAARPASAEEAGTKKDGVKKLPSVAATSAPPPPRPAPRPTKVEKAKPDVKKPVPTTRSAPPPRVPAAPRVSQATRPTSAASTLKPTSKPGPAPAVQAKPLAVPKGGKPTPTTTPQKSTRMTTAATPSPSATRVATARALAAAASKVQNQNRGTPTSGTKKPPSSSGPKDSPKKVDKTSDAVPPPIITAQPAVGDAPPQVNGNPVVVETNGINGYHPDHNVVVNIVDVSQPEA